jgi:lysyl-tRNA synthetase class 2
VILSDFLKTTRQYFWGKDFTEVEAKYLNKALPLEPNIYLFQTQNYFLPASPEFACKEFLVKNKTDCFSLAHSFRVEEDVSKYHFPEFMMLEYYLVNKNIVDLQKSLELFLLQFAKFKFENLQLPNNLPNNEPDFNQYFLNNIENNLPKDKAVFIYGYPSFLSPLAAPNQRFELYINGIEIANGCQENSDSKSIKLAFEAENSRRLQNNLPTHPYPQDFIDNCSKLPPCSGVAMGIDRLLQIINTII